jgi:hypothetical protein
VSRRTILFILSPYCESLEYLRRSPTSGESGVNSGDFLEGRALRGQVGQKNG